jgi:cell division protein FtsW (lipid II flippase)
MLSALLRSAAVSDGGRYRVSLVNVGWVVVISALLLSAVGVYAIDVAVQPQPEGAWDLGARSARQLVYLGIGLAAAAVIALPHYRLVGLLSAPAAALAVALLVFLLIPFVPESIVKAENGARSWINFPGLRFQPSELAKISFVLVVARYMRYRTHHRRMAGLVPPALIAAIPIGLITLQPDLGTASLFVPVLFAMLVAAGARLRHLAVVVLIAALAAPAVYPILRPHQKQRIVALLNQIRGERGAAQTINYQGFVAQTYIGSGQAAGMPDARARTLIRYNYLPARHNDMVFSVVAMRFGLLGAVGVLALYLVWFGGALWVAGMCKDPFGRLLTVGLASFVAAQVVVNVGMNVGLVPIIGITLPFVSAGGSSMLTCWLMTGLIFNVAMRRPVPPFRPSFEYGDEE